MLSVGHLQLVSTHCMLGAVVVAVSRSPSVVGARTTSRALIRAAAAAAAAAGRQKRRGRASAAAAAASRGRPWRARCCAWKSGRRRLGPAASRCPSGCGLLVIEFCMPDYVFTCIQRVRNVNIGRRLLPYSNTKAQK